MLLMMKYFDHQTFPSKLSLFWGLGLFLRKKQKQSGEKKMGETKIEPSRFQREIMVVKRNHV